MKISIVTIGTRGDVQPYVALGQGLQRAGHRVQIVTFTNFAPFVRQHGLSFAALTGDAEAMMRQIVHAGGDGLRFGLLTRRYFEPIADQIMEDIWQACQGTDLIIYNIFVAMIAHHIAEGLDVPAIRCFFSPFSCTRAFPSTLVGWRVRPGGAYNWLTHILADYGLHLGTLSVVNRWRRRHGLRPLAMTDWPYYATLRDRPTPVLYPISEHVLPRPEDWGAHIHTCGYWFLDQSEGWQPSDILRDFLAAGPPPVYIGFGSIVGADFERLTRLAVQALRQSGQRGIIQRGWGGLSTFDRSDDVLLIDAASHDWLFPQMAAVVHHGGAGTTATGLRAGVPTIVVPFFGDQPFWGERLTSLGVSPGAIPHNRLTSENFAEAISQTLNDPQIRARAARLGAQLRAEDGVGRAVRIIEAAA
jgi:sterol 3beta-glucosyltransferase